jgi:hypothetical protein
MEVYCALFAECTSVIPFHNVSKSKYCVVPQVTDLWITESLPATATADDDSYQQHIGFKFKEETSKCYSWSIAL